MYVRKRKPQQILYKTPQKHSTNSYVYVQQSKPKNVIQKIVYEKPQRNQYQYVYEDYINNDEKVEYVYENEPNEAYYEEIQELEMPYYPNNYSKSQQAQNAYSYYFA